MFLENITRKVGKFDLDDADDKDEYETLLQNPLVQVLDKKWEKQRFEEWEGDGMGTVKDILYLIVEYEEKSL